jgi:hypothetical protein
MCGDDAPALLRTGTLLDCMRDTQLDDLCGHCGDDVVVCLDADGAASALLRDVLLRKAPLPGFGLVPADWVPAEAHSNALLLALMAASPNAAALRRVWTAQRARGGVVDADGLVAGCFMLRLMRLLEAVCHSGMPWSAPDVDAAHAMALDALMLAEGAAPLAAQGALQVLGRLTFYGGAPPDIPDALPLMLTAVRCATRYEGSAAALLSRILVSRWLCWVLLSDAVPTAAAQAAGERERDAVRAFSRGGGAAFLLTSLNDALNAAGAADAALGGLQQDRWTVVLSALRLCHMCDADALTAGDGVLSNARALLAALRAPGKITHQTRKTLLTLLSGALDASLTAGASQDADDTPLVAAFAASDAPEQAVRVLHEWEGSYDGPPRRGRERKDLVAADASCERVARRRAGVGRARARRGRAGGAGGGERNMRTPTAHARPRRAS